MSVLKRGAKKIRREMGKLSQAFRIPFQFLSLKRASGRRFSLQWSDRWLCFGDATQSTGFDRHYIYHTAWACRVLAETRPKEHVDVSSSLYFVALASAFVPIRFFDYRPAALGLSGLDCAHADLTRLQFEDASVQSISCMHVVEHVGLARYGDPLDYDGDLKAVAELKRVVALGGQILFVVPIGGKSRIQFNAHRIYTYAQVLDMFRGFQLAEFALVPDDGSEQGLVRGATEEFADQQRYGCGCFLFRKEGA